MKLDLDYIQKLLQIMEDKASDVCLLSDFVENNTSLMEVNEAGLIKINLPKLRKHLRDLCLAGCIECDKEHFGFYTSINGDPDDIGLLQATYYITIVGHALLESMKNDNLWNKIKSNLKVISFETLKTMPALALQILLTTK